MLRIFEHGDTLVNGSSESYNHHSLHFRHFLHLTECLMFNENKTTQKANKEMEISPLELG